MLCCIPPGTNMSLRSRRSRLRWKFNRWRLGHRIVSQNTGSEESLQERQLRAPGTIGRVRNHEYLCRPVPIQLPPITANIEGFLVETMSFLPKQSWKKGPINVAVKDEIGRYESSRGTEVTFEIIPQAGRTYTEDLHPGAGNLERVRSRTSGPSFSPWQLPSLCCLPFLRRPYPIRASRPDRDAQARALCISGRYRLLRALREPET